MRKADNNIICITSFLQMNTYVEKKNRTYFCPEVKVNIRNKDGLNPNSSASAQLCDLQAATCPLGLTISTSEIGDNYLLHHNVVRIK